MVVPWQGAFVFVGLTGLPHPEVLHGWATKLMSALQINLPQFDPAQFGPAPGYTDSGSGDGQDAAADMAKIMLYILMGIVLLLVGNIVAICLYKSKVHDAKPKIPDGTNTMAEGKFHYGLFECFSNCNECMCAFCCPTVRYADTHSAVSGSFWGSFCYFIGVNVVIGAVGTMIVQAVYPAPNPFEDPQAMAQYQGQNVSTLLESLLRGVMFGVVARKQLRERLGDKNASASAFHDFLAWGFLSCCALTQESVEADIAADVTISCPFTLEPGRKGKVNGREVAPDDYEKMLGDAVLLEGGR